MKFSIIIPSYLGEYKHAALDREKRFRFALNSALNQTYRDFEIILISDGCDVTTDIYQHEYSEYKKITCYQLNKQKTFSGHVRNQGLVHAKGDYIIYLDIDDFYGKDHLKIVEKGLKNYDWVYFNEIVNEAKGTSIKYVKISDTEGTGIAGTSSICHKRGIANWLHCDNYQHDWQFILKLLAKSKNYAHVGTSEYNICHMVWMYDNTSYYR